jgi:hypothetical protein
MINFYTLYNNTGLDKDEYAPLIDQLNDMDYNKEMSIIEHIIKKNPKYAYRYANRCLKSRWIEAEPIIMLDPYVWPDYCRKFGL